MLNTSTATLRMTDRAGRVPRVSDREVWRAAAQLRKQFPETPWLEASHRADRAYAAGHMFHFRLWGRVTHALRRRLPSGLAAAR